MNQSTTFVRQVRTNYATLPSGIPWNIPRVTCIKGECVYQENTSDEWDIPQLYHEKGLYNCFVPRHRKHIELH